MTYHWIAPPDIDLGSPEMRVARAYFESRENYIRTADLDVTYPGFARLIEETSQSLPLTGTTYIHVLSITPSTDDRGNNVDVVHVCQDFMRTAKPSDTGWVRTKSLAYRALQIRRTEPPRDDTGLFDYEHYLPYPTWDVFSGWEVETILPEWKGNDDPWNTCMWGIPGVNQDTPRHEELLDSPVVEPFYPGWPTLADDEE
ncbi:hypothetical protein [Rhodococcus sp. SJ-3]|uniref:hypothetical protein n=1 Tax=Rhodococcus sp. SJ-3 TaxID=3454628 RepID=UPI003F79291A